MSTRTKTTTRRPKAAKKAPPTVELPTSGPQRILSPSERLTLHELNEVRKLLNQAEFAMLSRSTDEEQAATECETTLRKLDACVERLNTLLGILR